MLCEVFLIRHLRSREVLGLLNSVYYHLAAFFLVYTSKDI